MCNYFQIMIRFANLRTPVWTVHLLICAGPRSVVVRDSLLLVKTHCTGVREQGSTRERVGAVLVAHAALESLAELVHFDECHRHPLAHLFLPGDLVIFGILVRHSLTGTLGQ